jgi:thiol-disulfide isomerase/thioredoxin
MSIRRFSIVLIILTMFLSACASVTTVTDTSLDKPTESSIENTSNDMQISVEDAVEEPTQVMEDPTAEEMMGEEVDENDPPETMEEVSAGMVPNWFSATLVNVNTQERFKIEDYKGKVILVETLAMWCSTCRMQQKQVVLLHELLGERDDFISIGLDIDPNELPEDLSTYTQNNGFDWIYAVSPPKVSNEIAELYGNQFLNPPSAPMFIIDREGKVHPLRFGVKNAEELADTLQPFLDVAM